MTDERNRTCGQHPTLGNVAASGTVRACGKVLEVADLYRCADCNTAFCRECIRTHFKDSEPAAEAAAFEYAKKVECDFFDSPDRWVAR